MNILTPLFRKWRTRGAIAPSSPFLVNKMIRKIDYAKDLDICQLGFGDGVFTKGLLKKLSPKSTLTIFEVNKECRAFMIDDARIRYIEDSAEYMSTYCKEKEFDHIVSTLPFASLPKEISQGIFNEVRHHLKKGGKFLQFQYSLFSKKDIELLFNQNVVIDFELRNIPPAFIYETERGEE